MTTVRYFWHAFIHRGTTFMCLQYSRPLIYHLLPNVCNASYTISASIFVDVPYWPPYSTDKFISCLVPGPSQCFFRFGEEIVISCTHVERVLRIFQISQCQRRNRSVTAAVWLSALSWRMMGFCTTKCRRFLLVYAVTISSPRWKKYCRGPGTKQEINLSLL